MSKYIDRIEKLIEYLPSKDVNLGYKFLKNRNFENLLHLVSSAIIRTDKNLKSSNIKEEYKNVNMCKLNTLKAELDIYITLIDLPLIDNIYEESEI